MKFSVHFRTSPLVWYQIGLGPKKLNWKSMLNSEAWVDQCQLSSQPSDNSSELSIWHLESNLHPCGSSPPTNERKTGKFITPEDVGIENSRSQSGASHVRKL